MIEGLLGALILIGILLIVAWVIILIIQQAGPSMPPVVSHVIWAVMAIICLVILARGLGVAIPNL
jgi:hypothetical protein